MFRSTGIRAAAITAACALAVSGLALTGATAASATPSPVIRAAAATSTATTAADHPWGDRSKSASQRASLLLKAMTLDEKVNMLHGAAGSPVPTTGYLAPIPRLGVPGITMTDGPAGIRSGVPSTELPAPLAQAASFDPAVGTAYGKVAGADARATGQDQVFGPAMNIARVPTNGRNFEYLGEDPYLSGTISGADVRGIQSQGVIATIKHYLANNQETDRMGIDEKIDDRTLHELYGQAFDIAVQKGHPGSVMCAYNQINSTYACSNASTLTTMLRGQFGFDGFVVSDYPATHSTNDLAAGLNVELPSAVNVTTAKVQAAIAAGTLTEAQVDQRVKEVLTVLFRFGLFDRDTTATSPIDQDSDNAAAQSIEEKSAVLLKNSGSVLPLTAKTSSIAVIGAPAAKSTQGGGSSQVQPLSVDNSLDAITARAGSATTVTYDAGTAPATAAAAAKKASTALVFVHDTESEGSDRANLSLPDKQDALVSAVAAANPHTVVVLETGGPVLMPWLSQVAGVLEAWYPGARGGAAIARLLYGDVNPSGKLPQTFPARETDVPASTPAQYPGVDGVATYSEKLNVGYRWFDSTKTTPLFPFGYGLSYTSFDYSNLRIAHPKGTSSDKATLSFTVTNTGKRAGSEAAQVYVAKPHTLVSSPPQQLAAYKKVTLGAGKSTTVSVDVAPQQLAYWDTNAQAFTVQDGTYGFSVGGSSRSLDLTGSYRVTKTDGPIGLTAPKAVTATPGKAFTVSTTLSNRSDYPFRQVKTSLKAPAGWTVQPLTTTDIPSLAKGVQSVVQWKVTVPKKTAGGTSQLSVSATGTVDGTTRSVTRQTTVTVPFASLAAADNTVGVTADADPTPGNFDGSGYSYSAEGLATVGVAPGKPVSVDGTTIAFPDVAAGEPDVVTAAGQVVMLSGKGRTLTFLGAASNGTVTGTVTVTYTDKTTATVPLTFGDWYANDPAPDGSLVATSPTWNRPAVTTYPKETPVSLYGWSAKIDRTKSVASITLPNSGSLHVFGVSIH